MTVHRFLVTGDGDQVWLAALGLPGPGIDWIGCSWEGTRTTWLVATDGDEPAARLTAVMEAAGCTVAETDPDAIGWPQPP